MILISVRVAILSSVSGTQGGISEICTGKESERFGWIICTALVTRHHWPIVHTKAGVTTTVLITKTYRSGVERHAYKSVTFRYVSFTV